MRAPKWLSAATVLICAVGANGQKNPEISSPPYVWRDCRWVRNIQLNPDAQNFRPVKSGYIATNTVGFQEYALETALKEFQRINRALNLGAPDPVSCADITKFIVKASYYGLHCSVTIRNRFSLLIQRNRISNFSDYNYFLLAFENRPERLDELLASPNLLTKESAEKVARNALEALGLVNGNNLRLREPPYVRQWETDTGPMPFFDVIWKDAEFKGPADAIYGDAIFFEICGVNTNVAHFYIVNLPSSTNALRLPYATNFFELLGMSPTNRFWTVKWKTENE